MESSWHSKTTCLPGGSRNPLGRHGQLYIHVPDAGQQADFHQYHHDCGGKDHPEHLRDDCFRAALLNEIKNKFMKRSIQTIVYLPNFLSWVILATVVVNIFSYEGPINAVLEMLGIEPILFMASNKWFRSVLIVTDVWKGFGYGAIIYLAALSGIDPGLYEAAAIDGANRFKRVWHITLPGILPTIMLVTIMNLPNVLNAGFDQIFNLYNPSGHGDGGHHRYLGVPGRPGGKAVQPWYRSGAVALDRGNHFDAVSQQNRAKSDRLQDLLGRGGMIEKRTFGGIVADIIIWIIVGALALSCLMPLMNIVAISLSDNAAVSANLVNIFPIGFNISSYQEIMGDKQFWRSFGISVLRVVLGLSVNITLLVLTAYPLSKSPKFFTGQKVYMSLILFAMLLFSGGLIPTFMVVNSLKLTNTIWALILPGAVPLGNVILLMNAFRGVPKSLEEAAMIDGGPSG